MLSFVVLPEWSKKKSDGRTGVGSGSRVIIVRDTTLTRTLLFSTSSSTTSLFPLTKNKCHR